MRFSALALIGLAVGCGCSRYAGLPPLVPVAGKVTLANGQPVGNVRVLFFPVKDGAPASGVVGPDGAFALKTNDEKNGVAPGTYKVSFGPAGADQAEVDRSNAALKRVPRKYLDDDSTTLTVEVTPSTSNLAIKLDAR